MWTVVYIAYNDNLAQELKDYLNDEGIMARTRACGVSRDGESSQVEILVPELEAEEALDLLQTYLSENIF